MILCVHMYMCIGMLPCTAGLKAEVDCGSALPQGGTLTESASSFLVYGCGDREVLLGVVTAESGRRW